MSISFRCPHCKAAGRIADKYLGKRVRCPKCGGSVLAQGSGNVEPAIESPMNLKSGPVPMANASGNTAEGSGTRTPHAAGLPAVVPDGVRPAIGLQGSPSPHSTDIHLRTRFSSLPKFVQRPTRRTMAAVAMILIVAVLIARGLGIFATGGKPAPARLSFATGEPGSKADPLDVVMTLTPQWWDTEPGLTATDMRKIPDVAILPEEVKKLDEESFALFALENLARDWYRLLKNESERFSLGMRERPRRR